ncbi:MAG TPA: hypothetical protein VHB21_23665 [Minicystis sp.]|nr:hypothetical protein [Minicystis sp.]
MENNYESALESNQKAHAPRTQHELEMFLQAVHEHAHDIKGWKVNAATNAFEADLNLYAADALPPIYIMPKRGKAGPLRSVLDRVLRESTQGFPCSASSIAEIWHLVDQSAAVR